MLTLLLAYGAYRNAKAARRALEQPASEQDALRRMLLVSYGVMLFLLWPLLIPAAILRYVANANPLGVLAPVAVPLLSLFFLGVEFYFVYSLIFLVVGFGFTVSALEAMNKDREDESTSTS